MPESTITDLKSTLDSTIAVGEYGTQAFWYNPTDKKFEYALPLVSGGEYGGETETFEAPEMDLDYVPKISGRTSLNDITLTSNYTKDRHKRWLEILSLENSDGTKRDYNSYLEVYSDGSATMYAGTAGRPTIQGGDVRQIEVTIAPTNMIWVYDINNVSEDEFAQIKGMLGFGDDVTWSSGYKIPFNYDSIPEKRVQFFEGTKTGA